IVHWGTLAAFAAAPAVIALAPQRFGLEGGRFDLRLGIVFSAAALALLAGCLLFAGRPAPPAPGRSLRVAAFSAALVLFLQYPIVLGYSRVSTSDLKPLADVVWAQYPDALLYEYEPGTRTRSYYDLPIYAGRVSRKTSDPASMPPTDRPQVVVFFHRQGEPPTLAAPW